MSQIKNESPDFRGYHVPVRIEALGEEDFKEIVSFKYGLLLLGSQVPVWDEEDALDLLALDREGRPWIFELKRDTAKPAAISQLLTYGSYIASLDFDRLDEIYRSKLGKTSSAPTLADAFFRHFKKPLERKPDFKPGVVLVLVAFDFSKTCVQAMRFLANAGDLRIGRLRMKWVVAPGQTEKKEYQYLVYPSVIDALRRASPGKYAIVFSEFHEASQDWNLARKSGILLLPPLDDPDDPYVPNYPPGNTAPRPIPYEQLEPGMGLFVYAYVNDCREDPDDLDSEQSFDTDGLVGYGIIQENPHELEEADLLALRHELNWTGDDFESRYKGIPWGVQMEWIKTLDGRDATTPNIDVSQLPVLAFLKSDGDATKCFKALGLELYGEKSIERDPPF